MINILVTHNAEVLAQDGIQSHEKLEEHFRVRRGTCIRYTYDLLTRIILRDPVKLSFNIREEHRKAAEAFFDKCAGTPERLVSYVKRGNWDPLVLPQLIKPHVLYAHRRAWRRKYLKRVHKLEILVSAMAPHLQNPKTHEAMTEAMFSIVEKSQVVFPNIREQDIEQWCRVYSIPDNRK